MAYAVVAAGLLILGATNFTKMKVPTTVPTTPIATAINNSFLFIEFFFF